MSEWKKTTLREVIQINPATVDRDFKSEWIEYIDISSVGEGIITESPKVIKLKEAPSRAKRLVSQNDTVISTVRPNRRSMFFAKDPKQNWVLSTGFAVLRPIPDRIEPRFLYAVVFSREFTEYLVSREKGAAYPAVLPEDICEAEILLPPLPEQKAIARILGSLDDKIELNRRMNETLEAMARAIFKDWFVDFGPTRAKMEGRTPYLPEPIWSLFPEAIDPLSGLPMGWDFEPIRNIANITSGKRPSRRENQKSSDCQIPLYGGAGQVAWVAEPLYQHSILITGRVGTLGLVHRIEEPSWPSDNTLVIIPKDSVFFDYLYFSLNEVDFLSFNRGSTQPLITQTDLKKLDIIKLDYELSSHFSLLAGSFMSKIKNYTLESRTLAELRDRLLPKLMSGEIRVKDAERLVEEVL